MPSGYTSKILKGCTFEEFVWACARGMDFMIHMRDDPMDKPIRIKDASFYSTDSFYETEVRKLVELQEKISVFDDVQWDEYIESLYQNEYKRQLDYIERKKQDKIKYEEMLKLVKEWNAPEKLEGLKKFMIEQIYSSIDFDCGGIKDLDSSSIKRQTRNEIVEKLEEKLARYQKEIRNERHRTEERLIYLRELDESVPRPRHLIPSDEG